MTSFESWVRAEINRLRSEEQRLRTEEQRCALEAGTLQAYLDRWMEADVSKPTVPGVVASTNGTGKTHPASTPPAPPAQALEPDQTKRSYFLGRIHAAGAGGVSRKDMFAMAAQIGMNRGNARALLWDLTERNKLIERRGDRYFPNKAASTGGTAA